MFESAEQKAAVLAMLDQARAAIEQEDHHALEELMLFAITFLLRTVAKDIPGALPLIILEEHP